MACAAASAGAGGGDWQGLQEGFIAKVYRAPWRGDVPPVGKVLQWDARRGIISKRE